MRAYINNKPFDFDQEITILEAARQMGFFIPTLCAFKPLCHTPGTCAVCIVRVKRADGQELTLTSCKTPLEDGMEVDTISTQVKKMQRTQVALIFADHDMDCVTATATASFCSWPVIWAFKKRRTRESLLPNAKWTIPIRRSNWMSINAFAVCAA